VIWLSWRQFRSQALAGGVVLFAVAALGIALGEAIRHTYDTYVSCSGCTQADARTALETHYLVVHFLLGQLVIAAPAVIGAFWGAPLVARELEAGTHRLAWSQSVTRFRWLAIKLGLITIAGMILSGAISLLIGWATGPYDSFMGDRFSPLIFSTRGIVPLGYAAFAVVAGTLAGLLTRHTLPAMGITIAAFVVLQLVVPGYIRPHFEPPVSRTLQVTQTVLDEAQTIGTGPSGSDITGYAPAGAWPLTPQATLKTRDGTGVSSRQFQTCMQADPASQPACVERLHATVTIAYQPANRYWSFQWIETCGYLGLAALLAGLLFWRIRRGIS